MASEPSGPPPAAPCPRCGEPLVPSTVKTAIWQGERLSVVEDVPALVCASCSEQYYDDDVTDALRKLNEEGFPESSADKTIRVSVFSLEGRIRQRRALPEDTYVD